MTQLNYSRYELDANLEDKRKSSILDIIILKKGKTKPSKLNSFRYKQPVKLKSSAGENKALLQQLRPDALIVYNILHSDRIPNFLEKKSGFYLMFFLRYRYSKRIFET